MSFKNVASIDLYSVHYFVDVVAPVVVVILIIGGSSVVLMMMGREVGANADLASLEQIHDRV